ncbi:MAG TPA: ABC transporter ATP-binding protein [Bauldia sp.]|nr:ABC transporter ATP-binding protein [Bauldia sp.]
MTALLEARRVSKIYGEHRIGRPRPVALEDFSLVIDTDHPSITAVVGESGSGKTTLARLLLGLETPTTGEVLYKGHSLRSLGASNRHAFRRDVQVVFQNPFEVYNPFYTVDHALEVPIAKFLSIRSKQERRAIMMDALAAVGLRPNEILGRYPHQLSGGQRQRIMVARALLLKPKVIIADEPVSMIDVSLRATVLGNLQQLKDELGISIIYITHDLATAYQISRNIIVLYSGSVVEAGDVNRVVPEPQHPYTQLLINSVPWADPERHWTPEPSRAHPMAAGPDACKFANRCPNTMPRCIEHAPPLYRTEPSRLAACYLYDQAPVSGPDGLMAAFGRLDEADGAKSDAAA